MMKNTILRILAVTVFSFVLFIPGHGMAAPYLLNAGDQLHISVWGEEDLQQDLLILPDGTISYPLVGVVQAAGMTIPQLKDVITRKLQPYIPDATVTITVNETSGNLIYVIGKVNRPGTYPITRQTDVLQALSLAGGLSRFAKESEILVLRRQQGKQKAISFDYTQVIKGKHLETNIILNSGDTIVVP